MTALSRVSRHSKGYSCIVAGYSAIIFSEFAGSSPHLLENMENCSVARVISAELLVPEAIPLFLIILHTEKDNKLL